MNRGSGAKTGLLVGGLVAAMLTLAGAGIYRVHSAHSAALAEDGLTLNPDQFEGDTRRAYAAARAHPELLAQLDCYCGCEQHEGHKNLLDCFRSAHGAGCETCVGEAVTASQLADQGMPLEQIRAALRQRYAHGS